MTSKNELLPVMLMFILVFLVLGSIIVFSPKNVESPITENVTLEKSIKSRRMSVAGQFYPLEKSELSLELEEHLSSAVKISANGKLRLLIVPHAGTRFSGLTTAAGIKQINPEDYNKIIVIGVLHENNIKHAALLSEGTWETPLGDLMIDTETANRIINNTNIRIDENAHKKEHSIELISIFLKSIKPEISFVPILLGQVNNELLNTLSYKLVNIMDENTLIIVSTDLSHYPSYEDALEADNNMINALITGKLENLEKAEEKNRQGQYKNLVTSACGYQPLRVAMKISEILNITDIKKISYTNSGDISGDKERVVGYTAIGFYSTEIKPIHLSDATKKEALKVARETLNNLFAEKKSSMNVASPEIKQPIGAFTTLTIDGNLRGCIGQFDPEQSLAEVIRETAGSAATKDPRFKPITKDELENIEIEISTMTPLKKIDNWQNIELGKHGVRLSQGNKSGVLLPQVATDNNWDLFEFLETICSQKMGLDKNCYKDTKTEVYIFETEIFSEKDF